MSIKFKSRIAKLEERRRLVRGWKDEKGEDHFEYESQGWFMLLEGSWESIYVGDTKPLDFEKGNFVTVTIEKDR